MLLSLKSTQGLLVQRLKQGAFSGELCKFSSDLNRHSDIILHNAGRRTHLTKIAGVHQGKISSLCWADDHRVLSCGADRNIEMWDVRLDAPLDSSGAGPSHVCFVRFHVWHFITLSQPKPLSASPGKGTLQSVLVLCSRRCN
jgi:WD40 repeat protein